MRFFLRSVALLLVAYAVIIGGITLWVGYSSVQSESQIVRETLTLFGQELAASLEQPIEAAQDPTNLLADYQLRRRIEEALEKSDIATSISVVGPDGRVLASDRVESGTMLPPVYSVFRGPDKPAPFVRAIPGLLNENQHVLYLPLWQRQKLAGYLQISFHSTKIQSLADRFRQRFVRELAIALGALVLAAFLLHLQVTRHAQNLVQFLEKSATPGADIPKPENNEFSAVYRAAERMGQEVAEARRHKDTLNRQFGQLGDVIRAGLIWFRPDQQIEFANGKACTLIGVADVAGIRAQWDRVAPRAAEIMSEMERSGEVRSDPVDMIVGDPPHVLRFQFYRIGETENQGYAVLVSDPGILESLEDDVYLASQMKSLARVCRTVAHELRSPLTSMIVNMDLLRDSLAGMRVVGAQTGVNHERYISVVQGELDRLNKTLVEMLDQVAPFSQRPERIDLAALVRDLADLLGEHARRQDIDLDLEIEPGDVFVLGRSDHLKQAFLNILVNALEAMPSGGRLFLRLQHSDHQAHVVIRDTGQGLPQGVLDHIYELGYSTKLSGTGTGLHVARTLVEQHGGRITARNESGAGATFEIHLPMIAAQSEELHAARAAR